MQYKKISQPYISHYVHAIKNNKKNSYKCEIQILIGSKILLARIDLIFFFMHSIPSAFKVFKDHLICQELAVWALVHSITQMVPTDGTPRNSKIKLKNNLNFITYGHCHLNFRWHFSLIWISHRNVNKSYEQL